MKIFCITGKRGAGDAIDAFAAQGLPFDFSSVEANYSKPARHGIKLAHAEAVAMMRLHGGTGIVCEDDILFSSTKSLQTFIEAMSEAKKQGYDVLLGGVSHCRPKGEAVNGVISVACTSGMHMYAVLNDSVDLMKCPMSEHVDNWVGMTYKVGLCWPMVALQRAGYSEHHCKVVDHISEFKRYPILL